MTTTWHIVWFILLKIFFCLHACLPRMPKRGTKCFKLSRYEYLRIIHSFQRRRCRQLRCRLSSCLCFPAAVEKSKVDAMTNTQRKLCRLLGCVTFNFSKLCCVTQQTANFFRFSLSPLIKVAFENCLQTQIVQGWAINETWDDERKNQLKLRPGMSFHEEGSPIFLCQRHRVESKANFSPSEIRFTQKPKSFQISKHNFINRY